MYRILLVEDDRDDRELIEAMLKVSVQFPYQLVMATNLSQAQWQLDNNGFDLMIVDWLLRDGQVTEYGTNLIKRCAHRGIDTPAILVSGEPSLLLDPQILSMLGAGRLQYLDKASLTGAVLSRTVHDLMTRPIDVLVVDERPAVAERIEHCLVSDDFHAFRPRHVANLEQARELLAGRTYDLALVHTPMGLGAAVAMVDDLLMDGSCVLTAFLMYGVISGAGANSGRMLSLLDQPNVGFCSQEQLLSPECVPTLIQARSDSLAHLRRSVRGARAAVDAA